MSATRLGWWTCITTATVLALTFGALDLALGDRTKPALAASGSGLFVFGSTQGASFSSSHSSGGNYLIAWASIEQQNGSYSWSSLDAALGRATAAGKTLVLRVYNNWSSLKQGTPSWFFNVGGARHYYPSSAAQSRGYKAPVPWDTVFQQQFGDFVRALGQRYNGHSALEFIQITGVGIYGEIYLGSLKPSDFTNSKHLGPQSSGSTPGAMPSPTPTSR